MSTQFALISVTPERTCEIQDSVPIDIMAKIFKSLGRRSMDTLNGKALAVMIDRGIAVKAASGAEILSSLPKSISLAAIMDRGAQLELDVVRNNEHFPLYATCHMDGAVEASAEREITPRNPADHLEPGSLERRLREWLQSGDTGTSSETMTWIAFGGPKPHTGYPHDPADIGRCFRFLKAFPEAKNRLNGLRAYEGSDQEITHSAGNGTFLYTEGDVWGALLDHWDEIEALYNEEIASGKAPKCYARMKEVIQSAHHPARGAAPRG